MTVKFNKKMLLLLFVVILLIGISVVIAAFNRQEKDELVEIEYRVVFENVDEGFREKIKEGEIVYNSRTMAAVGRVVSVESGENYFVYEYDGESQIIKREYPNKTVWCYTGYLYENDLLSPEGRAHCECTAELLSCIDVLVDGPFVEKLHDITLLFRGSSNQRLIDLRKTESAQEIVLWEREH